MDWLQLQPIGVLRMPPPPPPACRSRPSPLTPTAASAAATGRDVVWPAAGEDGEGEVSPECRDLVERLLVLDPKERLGHRCVQCAKHVASRKLQ